MRKFGNRYYRKLAKTSDVYARNIAQRIRNRGINARVVKNSNGSTIFIAPRKYNARLFHGDWARGYSNNPGSRASDARFLTNQPIMAQYYASAQDDEKKEYWGNDKLGIKKWIPTGERKGGGRLFVLENDNPPLDMNPQAFDGSSGIEYSDEQLEKFRTGPYAIGNVWVGAKNDKANLIAGERLSKHLDIDAFVKAYFEFGGGWNGLEGIATKEDWLKMKANNTEAEIAAMIITAMADDLDNVMINPHPDPKRYHNYLHNNPQNFEYFQKDDGEWEINSKKDKDPIHFQMFQEAMLDAGLEYLVYRDVSPSTAFANARYPNMSIRADPMIFRRIPIEATNEMDSTRIGDYVEVTNKDDQQPDPSVTQFRIDDGSGRADVLKIVRVYEDEDYLFALEPEDRKAIANDVGIKPNQLYIYENVWDGVSEVDF